MTIEPLTDADVPTVAGWLARPDVHRWLDFGRGRQQLPPAALSLMLRQDAQQMRLVRDDGGRAVGVVTLGDINTASRSAALWYVIGEPQATGRGHATRAVAAILVEAFGPLRLHAVQAWAVDVNAASIRVLENNGFHRAGRLRACHLIEGRLYDRVLFDRLADDA